MNKYNMRVQWQSSPTSGFHGCAHTRGCAHLCCALLQGAAAAFHQCSRFPGSQCWLGYDHPLLCSVVGPRCTSMPSPLVLSPAKGQSEELHRQQVLQCERSKSCGVNAATEHCQIQFQLGNPRTNSMYRQQVDLDSARTR
jgi:hypothetical protein